MSDFTTEYIRVKGNIEDAYTQAALKGATLPVNQNSDNLPSTIATITGGGGGSTIVAAELPNTTIELSFGGSVVSTKTTDATTGGKVSFNVNDSGTYTIRALDSNDTQLWTNTVTVSEIGVYTCKSGKALSNYTFAEWHTILQGGYFSIMFSLKDSFTLVQSGNILNNHKFFVEKITKSGTAEIVDFRMAYQYTGGSYNINPFYKRLTSGTDTAWSTDKSTNGGYKYSAMRQRMMKLGDTIYSQATGIKPDDSTITDGIPFSQIKYTNNSNVSALYSYDTATDTFTALNSWTAPSTNTAQFVKGYWNNVGAIDETTFLAGNYYTYNRSTYVYTLATAWISGTTYYGFYEFLQEDGIFSGALATSDFGSYLARFSDYSSAGLTQTTSTTLTDDYADIPSIEEITGINRSSTLFSGIPATSGNAWNIPNEGTKKPCYDEFSLQTTGNPYWSRSATSNNDSFFCFIYNNGNITYNPIPYAYGVRLGFRLS